jgi:predicted esterase YcpF (UPF0227 family)
MFSLPDLLKSRRFQAAAVGLLMILLTHFVPSLEAQVEELTNAILLIIGLVVGGYTADHVSYNLGNKEDDRA